MGNPHHIRALVTVVMSPIRLMGTRRMRAESLSCRVTTTEKRGTHGGHD